MRWAARAAAAVRAVREAGLVTATTLTPDSGTIPQTGTFLNPPLGPSAVDKERVDQEVRRTKRRAAATNLLINGMWAGSARCRGAELRGGGARVGARADDVDDVRHRLVERHPVALRPVAVAERDRPVGHVLVPRDRHERHLLLLGVADLLLHAVVRRVHLGPDALRR